MGKMLALNIQLHLVLVQQNTRDKYVLLDNSF